MFERAKPFVVPPGGGRSIQGPVGGPAIIKAASDETAGSFAYIENVIPPKQGPPLHIHAGEDEMWLVLEGDLRFKADDEILSAPQGSFVFVPRGTAHCFQNIGEAPARIAVMFTPAGMERFFEQHAQFPAGPVDPAEYRRIATENGMTMVGPPLGESDPLREED